MKLQDNKIEITIYSRIVINFELNIKEKYMQDNLPNQNIPPIKSQPIENPVEIKKKNWTKISLFVLIGVLVVAVFATAGYFYFRNFSQAPFTKPEDGSQLPQSTSDLATYKILLNYEEKVGDNTYTNGIYLLDPNNPPPKKIFDNPDYQTENNSQFTNLQFTTDGKYLGWTNAGRKKGNSFEYGEVNDITISNIKSVKENWSPYLENFSWSPDGQRFALLERVGEGSKYSYNVRIFETKTTSQIIEFQIASTARQHSVNFLWSKGDKLRAVFVVGYTPTEEYRVVSYSPNGNKQFEKMIYSVASNSFRPIFDISHDGENIAFVKKFQSGSSYRGELWYGNFDGSNIRKVADTNVENCSNASPVTIEPNKNLIIVGSGCADSVKAKIINTENGTSFTADVDTISAAWSADGKFVWVTESLYNSSGQPVSQANYILNFQGKVVKKFDRYSSSVVWFPNKP